MRALYVYSTATILADDALFSLPFTCANVCGSVFFCLNGMESFGFIAGADADGNFISILFDVSG